jgi:GntR family transcriptional regulator
VSVGGRGVWTSSQCATLSVTLINVNIDREDAALLHEQVATEIRRAIADGEAGPGERLPTARHLAAVMDVHTNTVLRALRILRDEGLIEMRPRRGIRVVGTPNESEVRGKVADLVQLARQHGYTRAELLDMVANAS